MRPRLKTIVFTSLVLAAVLPCAPIAHTPGGAPSGASAPATSTTRSDTDRSRPTTGSWGAYLRIPLRFEAHQSDGRADTDFVARGAGYAVYLSRGDAKIVLRSPASARPDIITVRLVGGRPDPDAAGLQELPGRSNHLIGSDPRAWRTGVRSYARVVYRSVYPGTDLVYYGNQRQLEYDFIVAPGATPSRIAFAIEGAQHVNIDPDGNLAITTSAGTLTHRAPILYQEVNGARRSIDGGYIIRRDGSVGFRTGEYDKQLPLVIDPTLSYSSYLGGSSQERAHGVAVDPTGHIIVVGETFSSNFPTANPVQLHKSGFGDAFVAKLTPAGDALVYATFLGGSLHDAAAAVGVDTIGAAYVVGTTNSWDFPTLNGFQATNHGTNDAFVFKLDANGSLAYSTLLGGALEDLGAAIAIDDEGRAHVAGATWSGDFPTVNPLQPSPGGYPVFRTTNGGDTWIGQKNGLRTSGVWAFAIDPGNPETVYAGTDQFVFKSTDGGTTWARTGSELSTLQAKSVAIGDGAPASVYAATNGGLFRSQDGGAIWTQLPLFATVNAIAVAPGAATLYAGLDFGSPAGVYKSTDHGDTWTHTGLDAPIQALALSGSTIYASTPNGVLTSIAGEGWVPANTGLPSPALALAADPSNPGIAYAGTFDGLFKTTTGGASWEPDPILIGVAIGTIAIAPSDPSTLCLSSWFGGVVISNDAGASWRLTHSESATATAIAFHPHLATTAYIGQMMSRDSFIATVSADGSMLEYSTYLGGSNHDEITDIALGPDGDRYVVGTTSSLDLPVLNAPQPAFSGLQDAFAARIAAAGPLAYSTYLGGSGFESDPRLGVDGMGQAHVAGITWSSNFPVANAHQSQPGGGFADMFVSVLTAAGNGLVFSTYLGGNGMETNNTQSLGPDVAVSPAGDTYVTGTTMSRNYPTTQDAFQRSHGGGQNDTVVTKFDPAGGLQYSTFLGGAGDDYGLSIALERDAAVLVAGYTSSMNFPMRGALQPTAAGSDEGFIARISESAPPADSDPPATAIALTGTQGLAGWYRSPVVVTLSPNDGLSGSGIGLVQYSLNNGPWQTYSAPFTVSAQGTTQVSARSTDVAGNVEVPAPPTPVRIDTGVPLVAIVSPQAREYLYSEAVAVSVSMSDAVSGVSAPAALTIDGLPFSGSTIDLSSLTLGPHTLTATAVDVAGNSSQASLIFRVVSVIDTVIHVPAEMPTIQAAINVAVNGDTVLVSPGTYNEPINFLGKAITVTSEAGPAQTVIDARGQGTVVTFRSGETRTAVLSGFTIRGGLSTHFGGGIAILGASPTVRGNVIMENRSCTGVGIYSSFGSPLIENNRITRNTIHGCTGGWGIGVYIGGNSAAQVVGNEISENTGGSASGGGVALFAAGSAVVRANVIARNATSEAAGCGWGGGIMTANFSAAHIIDNVIVGNRACFGAGIHWGGSTGSNVFVNNTVADNEASIAWPGVYVSGFDARNQLHNNIFAAASGPALYCENAASLSSPVMNANDVVSGQGAAYGGTCADQTGLNGNISADPRFVNAAAGDYRVGMSSPVIDAGNDAAPQLPLTDVAGHPRVVDGNADGMAHVDLGAFEYRNRAPLADAGPDRIVTAAADCRTLATLNGGGSDPDGDALTFRWSGSFGTISGATPTVSLPAGTHVITLTVDDGNGGAASDVVVVTVIDSLPPVISSVTATPSVLTLNNHVMVPVVVTASASDGCGGAIACRIVSVTSNEPVDGTGDGDTSPDWEITGSLTVNLRAERSGTGIGRVYTITVQCTDPSGNSTTSTVIVSVPR